MKRLYLYLAMAIVMSVLLLSFSFFYIDREGRQTFLYGVYHNDALSGYEKIDRYLIENKLIYKSSLDLPFSILSQKKAQKIRFNKTGKELIDYSEEIVENGAKSNIYVKKSGSSASFLGVSNADFLLLDDLPVKNSFTIFNERDIVTYPPLIRRYNFKKRGEQFFNTLNIISPDMPPMPLVVSITAIGKDVITINGKKVKCENLIFELENGSLISVWITSAFRNILMIKIPKYGFKAALSSNKKPIHVEKYTKENDLCAEREIIFKKGDISLSGALSAPTSKNGPLPALLLIWDKGPSDKNASGIFVDIANALAAEGYCVFRFDKRGVGKSQGFFSTYEQTEEIGDLKSALALLKTLPEVDKNRIAVLGYGEGAFYASCLAGEDTATIHACILIAPNNATGLFGCSSKYITNWVEKNISDKPQYAESVLKALSQTKEMAMGQEDWTTIEGNSVFTKKVKNYGTYDMLETLKEVKAPVLIMQGKNDTVNPPEYAEEIKQVLLKNGNNAVTLVYFNDMNHLLGKIIRNGGTKEHIEIDPGVTEAILSWLNKNLAPLKIPDTEDAKSAENAKVDISPQTQ